MSATEIPIRTLMADAAKAMAIHTAAMVYVFKWLLLIAVRRTSLRTSTFVMG